MVDVLRQYTAGPTGAAPGGQEVGDDGSWLVVENGEHQVVYARG